MQNLSITDLKDNNSKLKRFLNILLSHIQRLEFVFATVYRGVQLRTCLNHSATTILHDGYKS
jgi:hypothetical protein